MSGVARMNAQREEHARHFQSIIAALNEKIEKYDDLINPPQDPSNDGEKAITSNNPARIIELKKNKKALEDERDGRLAERAERISIVERAREKDRRRVERHQDIQRQLAAYEERNRCCSIQ
jgi:hypothetical protein